MSDTRNTTPSPKPMDAADLKLAAHMFGSPADFSAALLAEYGNNLLAHIAALNAERAQVAEQLAGLLDWDLPDDPHGYADDYSEAVRKIATRLGLTLPT